MKKRVVKNNLFWVLPLALIAVLVIGNSGFKIYTRVWHYINPSPLKWETLYVNIPENFLAEQDSKSFSLFLLEDPDQAYVGITKQEGNFTKSTPFGEIFSALGYKVTGEKKCFHHLGSCKHFVLSVKVGGKEYYGESFIFLGENYFFSFRGKKENAKIFQKIIESLEFEQGKA